jgi:hypothetical protein
LSAVFKRKSRISLSPFCMSIYLSSDLTTPEEFKRIT